MDDDVFSSVIALFITSTFTSHLTHLCRFQLSSNQLIMWLKFLSM